MSNSKAILTLEKSDHDYSLTFNSDYSYYYGDWGTEMFKAKFKVENNEVFVCHSNNGSSDWSEWRKVTHDEEPVFLCAAKEAHYLIQFSDDVDNFLTDSNS